MKTLVLGVGSPFGADRLGWLAIDALRSRLDGAFDLEACDRPGARLLALMRGRERVVIIDAVMGDIGAGSLHCLRPEQLSSSTAPAVHGFGVAEAVALAGVLGELPPELTLIGIGAGRGDAVPNVDWDALAALVQDQPTGANPPGTDYS